MYIPLMRIPNHTRRYAHRTHDIPASIDEAAQVDVTCSAPFSMSLRLVYGMSLVLASRNNYNYVVDSYVMNSYYITVL